MRGCVYVVSQSIRMPDVLCGRSVVPSSRFCPLHYPILRPTSITEATWVGRRVRRPHPTPRQEAQL